MAGVPSTIIKRLLEAGVHFGHQTRKWNPKMKEYIFTEKSGIYIIDLQRTVDALTRACNFLREVAARGENILLVGTKKQAQQIVKEAAVSTEMFYVEQRWLGGFLTNFATIRKSVARLDKLEKMQEDGTFNRLSKKEISQLTKEMNKLKKNLEGTRKMDRLPNAVFVIDSKSENIAVKEANKLKIPVVALIDTNCDPDRIDYVIPGNDDAIRSIRIVTEIVKEAILEGRMSYKTGAAAAEAAAKKTAGASFAAEEKAPKIAAEKKPAVTKKAPAAKKPAAAPAEQKPAIAEKAPQMAPEGQPAPEEAPAVDIADSDDGDKVAEDAQAFVERLKGSKKEEKVEGEQKIKPKSDKRPGKGPGKGPGRK